MNRLETRTIEDLFAWVLTNKSDIRDHLTKLTYVASRVKHVTEFGTRKAVSSVALAAGEPDHLVLYDKNEQAGIIQHLAKVSKPSTKVEFHKADVLTMPVIDKTGFLFIDTLHTGPQLSVELRRHAGQVSRFIALHDTHTFGRKGQGGQPGMLPVIAKFLLAHSEWSLYYRTKRNNGLIILAKEFERCTHKVK